MLNIFLSYAYSDSDLVKAVSESIEQNNVQILSYDVDEESNISMGTTDIYNKLLSQLKNTDIFIVFLTKNSIDRKWVAYEISAATGYLKNRDRPRIIPIVFDDVSIPNELKQILCLKGNRENIGEFTNTLNEIIARLSGEMQANADERKENIAKVERSATSYINSSLEELRKREGRYKKIAYLCYIVSYISLLICIIAGIWRGFMILDFDKNESLMTNIQFSLASILIFSLIIALSRLTFILGKSFMVESLRNADRIHAISFGEFYLKAYGDKADWNEIKEAFQHWNIDNGSSFISQSTSDFDPELIKQLTEFTKVIAAMKK